MACRRLTCGTTLSSPSHSRKQASQPVKCSRISQVETNVPLAFHVGCEILDLPNGNSLLTRLALNSRPAGRPPDGAATSISRLRVHAECGTSQSRAISVTYRQFRLYRRPSTSRSTTATRNRSSSSSKASAIAVPTSLRTTKSKGVPRRSMSQSVPAKSPAGGASAEISPARCPHKPAPSVRSLANSYAIDPSLEATVAAKFPDLSKHLDENVLRHVGRFAGISKQAIDESINRSFVEFQKSFKSPRRA